MRKIPYHGGSLKAELQGALLQRKYFDTLFFKKWAHYLCLMFEKSIWEFITNLKKKINLTFQKSNTDRHHGLQYQKSPFWLGSIWSILRLTRTRNTTRCTFAATVTNSSSIKKAWPTTSGRYTQTLSDQRIWYSCPHIIGF